MTDSEFSTLATIGAAILIVLLVVSLVSYIIDSIGIKMIIKKGYNYPSPNKAFIPLYNHYLIYKLIGQVWLFPALIALTLFGGFANNLNTNLPISSLVSLVILVLHIYTIYIICNQFNLSKIMCILGIILPIGFLIVGTCIKENNNYTQNNYIPNSNDNNYYNNMN